MTEAADIAIVSFDKFINGGDAEQRAVAKQLYEAFSTVGWVYLKDFGISKERIDEIFELVSCVLSAVQHQLMKSRPKHSLSSHCNKRLHGVSRMPR